jgi:hypothetical protein
MAPLILHVPAGLYQQVPSPLHAPAGLNPQVRCVQKKHKYVDWFFLALGICRVCERENST